MVELHDLIEIHDAEESSSKGVLDKLAAVKRVVPKQHRRAVKNVVKQGVRSPPCNPINTFLSTNICPVRQQWSGRRVSKPVALLSSAADF